MHAPNRITQALAALAEGRSLNEASARDLMLTLMQGDATPAQIGALLMGCVVRAKPLMK